MSMDSLVKGVCWFIASVLTMQLWIKMTKQKPNVQLKNVYIWSYSVNCYWYQLLYHSVAVCVDLVMLPKQ